MREEFQMREEAKADNVNYKVKLSMLFITKFNGTHLDWFRFQNQFENDIQKSEKYGKHSEVAKAHVQNIMSLPHINNSNPYKIHEFSEKLLSSVQDLETMGKLKEIHSYLRLTLDTSQGIRADLVRTDNDWQDQKFPQLVETLEKWTCRNPKPLNYKPLSEDNRINPYINPNKVYYANRHQTKCVYCKKSDHKSADCQTVKTTSQRRKLLSEKSIVPLTVVVQKHA